MKRLRYAIDTDQRRQLNILSITPGRDMDRREVQQLIIILLRYVDSMLDRSERQQCGAGITVRSRRCNVEV